MSDGVKRSRQLDTPSVGVGEEAAPKRQRFGAVPAPDGNGAAAASAAGVPASPRGNGATASAPAAAAAAATAVRRPTLSLDALEKAKKALELQKQLQAKLKKLPALNPTAGAAAAAPGVFASTPQQGTQKPPPVSLRPAPLRLDEHGREVDERGHVVERHTQAVATLKVNRKPEAGAPRGAEALPGGEQQQQQQQLDLQQRQQQQRGEFCDPFLGDRSLRRLERRPRAGFHFFEPGRFQRQAERERLRAQFGDADAKAVRARAASEKAALAAGGDSGGAVDVNLIPLGEKAPAAKPDEPVHVPVPDVEWWDARLLPGGLYGDASPGGGRFDVRADRITSLVEHPVLLEPPAEGPPPPPQPLKLTKKEQKKLRTQRRQAREQEKQELMRQGLLEAPKPKVRISNLMRVLGAEATADPTAIEQEVRRQMAERQQAHEDRNLARKLTPAERREKKLAKLFSEGGGGAGAGAEEAAGATHVAVYKVGSLAVPKNRFKVDINAQENRLTGAALLTDAFVLVVVEGCAKSQRRYEKLMLRRIDWCTRPDGGDGDGGEDVPPNYCHLVWQGVTLEPAFSKFHVEGLGSEAAARKFMADRGAAHYWDLAKNYASP